MEYLSIGKITTTHGIKGEVKVYPLAGDLDSFKKYKDVKLYLASSKIEVNIESIREHKNALIVKFKEFDNINDVLIYKNQKLYISEQDRPNLAENEFYIRDIISLEVYDLKENYIGVLKDVVKGPSNDIYVVKNIELNEEYLIPGVKEFIKDINLEEKVIKIDPIDGMIE